MRFCLRPKQQRWRGEVATEVWVARDARARGRLLVSAALPAGSRTPSPATRIDQAGRVVALVTSVGALVVSPHV